jgi:hypothetical protein
VTAGRQYVIDDLEVCIVEEPTRKVRPPTDSERAALDRFFNSSPWARDDAGRVYRLYGEVIEGIDGLVLTYPAAGSTRGRTTAG